MPVKGLLSSLGYIMMAGGVAALLLEHAVVSAAPAVIACQVLAVRLMLWARLTFGRRSFHLTATPTQGGLVTSGPYRFIRHPIYSSVCLFAWASSLGHPSALTVAMAALVSLGAWLRIGTEESLLLVVYPEYAAYAAKTKRVVPFVL